MKLDLAMRYKKIVPTAIHTNSDKNLVFRQQFALELIKQLAAGKRVMNIDESQLVGMDYRRRKWRLPGNSNSHPILPLHPRISVIAALDTDGSIYLSLV